jgi:hypothetical protein
MHAANNVLHLMYFYFLFIRLYISSFLIDDTFIPTWHCLQRMFERHISEDNIREALLFGTDQTSATDQQQGKRIIVFKDLVLVLRSVFFSKNPKLITAYRNTKSKHNRVT